MTGLTLAATAPLDGPALRAWRTSMRNVLVARRMAASPEDRLHWGRCIDHNVDAILADVTDRIVGFCWPYRGEHDCRAAVLRMIARGARASLPVVVAPKSPLAFREWHAGVQMRDGAYGIPEPVGSAHATPDVLLLPANGFDEDGFRLGYGGGYFDRTMARLDPRPLVIGIAFELGRLPTIHPQPHDIPLDYVVTEAGAFRRGPMGLQPAGA